jgi:hypothetical protein
VAEFLDKIKDRLDKGLSTVNEKSRVLISRQKIRIHITELKAEREILIKELGKLTYESWEPSGSLGFMAAGDGKDKKAEDNSLPDKWKESVFTVLGKISGGGLGDLLLEDTAKQFKITAKVLYDEVDKLIPDSEKKGQNLQWLGRVLGKSGLSVKKASRRIDGERETVYVFDKKKTAAVLKDIPEGEAENSGGDSINPGNPDALIKKCRKIHEIDIRISGLEKELKAAPVK